MSKALKVLLVEDEPQDVDLIVNTVTALDEETVITCVRSVPHALHILSSERFDVAVIDINLGVDKQHRSGIDILAAIDKMCPRTKTLVYSIWDNEINRSLCFQHGARAFLSKLDLEKSLLDAIRGVMTPVSADPDYTQLGESFVRKAAKLSAEGKVALVRKMVEGLDVDLSQVRESQEKPLEIEVTAGSISDAQKLTKIIETYVQVCIWINENLDPQETSLKAACNAVGEAAYEKYGEIISKTQVLTAVESVMTARDSGENKARLDTHTRFESKAVFTQRIMGVKLSPAEIRLKTATTGYGRTKLSVRDEDVDKLRKLGAPTRIELVHLEDLLFQATLIKKNRR